MKNRLLFLTPCALVFILLSGCAERWEKPGASDADFQKTKAVCDDRAMLHFPISIRQIEIEGARMNPGVTNCTWSGSGGTMHCGTSGGQYEPPRFASVDDNQTARNQDVRKCFFDNGWHPAE